MDLQLRDRTFRVKERFIYTLDRHLISPDQHLKIINWLRFASLLFLTLRFGIFHQGYAENEGLLSAVQWALWLYFLFIVVSQFTATFYPKLFVSQTSCRLQLGLDFVFVTFFYVASLEPGSDIYFLYILPVFVLANHFSLRAFAVFLLLLFAFTVAFWWLQIKSALVPGLDYAVENLLSQLVFVGVLILIYLAYWRRRKWFWRPGQMEDDLAPQFRQLAKGIYTVDRSLRITSANDVMRGWHGLGLNGRTCQSALCEAGKRTRKPCEACPLRRAIAQGEEVTTQVAFVNEYGQDFPVRVSALPIFSKQGQPLGATAVVESVVQHDDFQRRLSSYSAIIAEKERDLEIAKEVRAREEARQLRAIFQASVAVLSPDKPLGVRNILGAMASLLHCRAGTVRMYERDPETGELGLITHHTFGYPSEDVQRWRFLGLSASSIVVDAYLQNRMYSTKDVQSAPHLMFFREKAQRYNLHAMACFPLSTEDEKLGTVSMYRDYIGAFSPREMALGQTIANNLTAALLNQRSLERLSEQAKEREQRLAIVDNLSRQLVPHDSIDSLTQFVADFVRESLNAEVAAIFLLEDKVLYRQAVSGVEANWFAEECYDVGQGITGKAVVTPPGERYGRLMLDNAVEQSAVVVPENLVRYSRKLASGSVSHLLAVPLNGQESTFGVLRVVNKLDTCRHPCLEGFENRDIELLTTLASIVAVAIENTRRLAEQTFLLSIGQTLTGSLSPRDVLAQSLDRAVAFLGAEAGAVLLPDDRTGDLVFDYVGGQGIAELLGRTIPIKKSISGAVFRTGKAALVPDVTQDPRAYLPTNASTVRSLVALPLFNADKVIGVLEIFNKKQGTFTSHDIRVLEALTAWIVIAVENARLYRDAKQRFQQAEGLREAMQSFSALMKPEEILDSILEQLGRVVTYQSASLFLLENEQLCLRCYAGFPEEVGDRLLGATLDATRNVPFAEMKRTQRPFIIGDNKKEQLLDRITGRSRTRSWIGAPLLFRNEILGHLAIDHGDPYQYTDDEADVVMAFAQQAAVAIANARHFDKETKRAEQLLVLNRSLVDFTRAPQLGETLDKIAACVQELLRCDISGVVVHDQDTGQLRTESGHGYCGISAEYATHFHFHKDSPLGVFLTSRILYTIEDATIPAVKHGRSLVELVGVRGVMVAPLFVGERFVGVLGAGSRSPRVFSEDEQTLFSILAAQAAVAIRDAELRSEKDRRARLLEVFHQISVATQRTSDLDRILNIVLTGVTAHYGLRFNRAILFLTDPLRENLVGNTGIGQTSKAEAQAVWEKLGHTYLLEAHTREVLAQGPPQPTAMHYVARNLKIPIRTDSNELFSRAFVTQESVIVDPSDGRFLIHSDFYRLVEPGQFALVPLAIDKRVIGMLFVDNKFSEIPITATQLELLGICASQAAAAIERSRLYQIDLNRIKVLQQLREMVQYISQVRDLHELLQLIVEAANNVLEADGSYLTPYDPERQELLVPLAASAGFARPFPHDRQYSSTGLTARVLKEPGGLLMIEDIPEEMRATSDFLRRNPVRSVAVACLQYHDEVMGVLYINYQSRHLFDEHDERALKMFADQAAIGIHSARMMEQMEQLATQKERNRLRDEMHDVLNTYQFKVMLPLETVRDSALALGKEDMVEDLKQLHHFSRYVNMYFHRIMQDMRDPVLVEKGLFVALLALKENFIDGQNVVAEIASHGEIRPSPEVEHAFYRIAQEAIKNALKHAHLAEQEEGRISIELILESGEVALRIADNGVGFDMDQARNGIGMEAMGNWARQIGASLVVESAVGRGTRLSVTLPPEEVEN